MSQAEGSDLIRAVRKGEPFVREVQGGVIRTPAPSDGIAVTLPDKDVFLDAVHVGRALAELGWTVKPPARR